MGFVVDKVALGQVFSDLPIFIPPILVAAVPKVPPHKLGGKQNSPDHRFSTYGPRGLGQKNHHVKYIAYKNLIFVMKPHNISVLQFNIFIVLMTLFTKTNYIFIANIISFLFCDAKRMDIPGVLRAPKRLRTAALDPHLGGAAFKSRPGHQLHSYLL
jgi:hypothetical protein